MKIGHIQVSVVLPCYNGGKLLARQLDSLAAQEYEGSWELLYVDNGSTDDSVNIAEQFRDRIPNLSIIDGSAERGQPFALNMGIRAARGRSILCCDADDEVAPGWLKAMAAGLKDHRFVASRMDLRKLNPPWLQSDHQAEVLPTLWYNPFTPYAAGATLGFHRALFDEIGPFDRDLPYLHDTEFCIQAQRHGVSIVLLKDALLHYRRRSSLRAHFRQARSYTVYNCILARRYMPKDGKTWPGVKVFVKDSLKIVQLLPRVRSIYFRYELIWMLGRQLGRVEGCLKFKGMPV